MTTIRERVRPNEFRLGQVWRADLRPTKGHEQTKERRVLIVQNDIANDVAACITVVPLTSYKGGRIYPVEVLIEAPEGGTTQASVIDASQIRTLDKELRFRGYCGTVSNETMEKVDEAMKIHLGLVAL